MYYLYFAKTGTAVKIGISKNTKKRIRSIQVYNHFPVEIVSELALADEKSARLLEKKLHSFFYPYKLSGEWFRFTSLTIRVIDALEDDIADAIRTMDIVKPFMDGTDFDLTEAEINQRYKCHE